MEKNNEMPLDPWVEERMAALHPDSEWEPDARKGLARLRERSGRRRRWTWAAAAATSACLGAMTLPGTRVLAERCVGVCSEVGVRLWQSLANSDHNMAPDFTLNDASGKPVKLSDFRGKVVLLNFWATWCPPCKVEIPWLVEFQQTYGDRDFVVLGVSLDEDGWKSVQPFLDDNKINYRVMIGNDDIAALYGGIKSLPTTLLIDKSGRIASTYAGLVSQSEYRTGIELLLGR
jgi:peroxiredoxin